MSASGWAGAVLTGGASRRMGRDKALVEVGGAAMAARVAAALSAAGAAEVFCVGGDLAALAALGLDARADDHPGQGPLGGILTALRLSDHDVVAVLACDLLSPSAGAVAALVGACTGGAATGAVAVVDGREQWLCAAWHRSSAAGLGAAFADGTRSVVGAAALLPGLARLNVPAAAAVDVDSADDLPGSDR